MNRTYETPTGELGRRVHGAGAGLRRRASMARAAAAGLPKDDPAAAALRGKATGLTEAADVLDALEHGRSLPPRSRDRLPGMCAAVTYRYVGGVQRGVDCPDVGVEQVAALDGSTRWFCATHTEMAADAGGRRVSEVQQPRCVHVFPDGTRCELDDHTVPGLAALHGVSEIAQVDP